MAGASAAVARLASGLFPLEQPAKAVIASVPTNRFFKFISSFSSLGQKILAQF
jgi:hypothetical protein